MDDKADTLRAKNSFEKAEVILGNTDINHRKVDYSIDDTISAWNKQIGGNHYKNFVLQPTEFIMKNSLSFLQGCIIKRICRYNLKGSPLEDLEKAKHEIDMLIEFDELIEFEKLKGVVK